MKIRKGDSIQVTSGKDAGKKGTVSAVSIKNRVVMVPELNTYKKHVKKSDAFPQGGIIELSRPLKVDNVALVCPSCHKPTRVGYVTVEGNKKRSCKKCKAII